MNTNDNLSANTENNNAARHSKLVDGYKRAFVDSTFDAEPSYTPQFISNSNGHRVLTEIQRELQDCDSMFMSVAFITKGGITPLKGTLKELEQKNIPGKVLTTDYLTFSDPEALDALSSLKNLEVRMFRISDVGFHTKGYLFRKNGDMRIIVGSSNLTQKAITQNYEWNTKVISTSDGQYAKDMEAEFSRVWESSVDYRECREQYAGEFNSQKAIRKKLNGLVSELRISGLKVIEPNEMQRNFSAEIERLIRTGQHRALLISATGTGKTYASAFAVRNIFAKALFLKKKVLFLSHREMINVQAQESYSRVLGAGFRMSQLSGSNQNWSEIYSADVLFSTMNMMAKDDVREQRFRRDEFSVIILDECHRSGAESYQKIINYFTPEFLLGMSATPERNDGVDIYKQFDHNIACEIRLQTALENNLLCPFHYFGIQDFAVDEIKSDFRNFRYLTSESRVNYVIERAEYYGYSGDRVKGLIFCSNKREADTLSSIFNNTIKDKHNGGSRCYRTVALSGSDSEIVRRNAISKLVADASKTDDYLDYIFTIDIFNEGVDIPEINQVIMLRPTESAIIFVQQLGRGLRKAVDKEFVVVLDFIANYESNYLIPIALSGDRTGNKDNIRRYMMDNEIKGASTIYFDEVSKTKIFNAIDRAQMNAGKLILEAYRNFKNKLGRRPALLDFDKYGEIDPLRILALMEKTDFKKMCRSSYYGFLVKYDGMQDELNDYENHILEFVSQKFASGKRLNEILMLDVLMESKQYNETKSNETQSGVEGSECGNAKVGRSYVGEDVIDCWRQKMTEAGQPVGKFSEENIISIMTGNFYNVGSSGRRFADCVLIENRGGRWMVSEAFSNSMKNNSFRDALEDVIAFAKNRFCQIYRSEAVFRIGQKYTYEDVFRLLDWQKSEVSLNVGGYKYDERTDTYPVFVNYDKSDDINDTIKYEDHFVDQSTIVAISKSNRHIDSKDVRVAAESSSGKVGMHLFVRKNKDDKEAKEFYYLGRIAHRKGGILKEFVMPNTKDVTAVEIEYKLEQPVEKGLYDYLTAN